MDPHLRETLARTLSPTLFREVVAEPEVVPTGDWVARSRAFALFEPIRSAAQFLRTSLARRKLDEGRPLERYDLEGLLLEAVDRVVDHYGLGESLSSEGLVSHLSGLVEQNEAAVGRAPDPAWCRSVAEDALEVLLNRRARSEDIVEAPHTAYVHRHLVPGAAPRTSAFGFLLLEEATEEGRRVVRARQEAVLFTVRMLDFDLEEMGEVLEELLRRQMERGNFAGARRTAEHGRQVANGYAAKIRARLDEARRRPLAVSYTRELAPILEHARRHLDERLVRERELRETVDRLRWDASPEVLAALEVIERELDCSNRVYVSLTRVVAEAPREHEARRARAFLGRVPPGTWPAPLDEVLLPALRLPARSVLAAGPALLRRLLPPSQQRLFDLASLVRRAFRPAPAPQDLEGARPSETVRPLPRPDLPLEAARALIERRAGARPSGLWLSELVAEAAHDPALATAVGLLVHAARAEQGASGDVRGWGVVEAGPRRRVGSWDFDDLRVSARLQAAPRPALPPRQRSGQPPLQPRERSGQDHEVLHVG